MVKLAFSPPGLLVATDQWAEIPLVITAPEVAADWVAAKGVASSDGGRNGYCDYLFHGLPIFQKVANLSYISVPIGNIFLPASDMGDELTNSRT